MKMPEDIYCDTCHRYVKANHLAEGHVTVDGEEHRLMDERDHPTKSMREWSLELMPLVLAAYVAYMNPYSGAAFLLIYLFALLIDLHQHD